MCDSATLMAIAAGGSAALGGVGKLYEGLAGQQSHEMAAELARGNTALLDKQALIAQGGADLAVTRGNYDEFLARRKGGQVLASETAHYAGNNVDASYGSPLAVEGYSAAQIEQDAELIRARTMTERADALTQTANIRGAEMGQAYRAASEDVAAKTSLVGGILGAGSSFLSAASKWPGLGGGGGSSGGGGGGASGDLSPGFTAQNVGQYSSRFLAGGNPWGR